MKHRYLNLKFIGLCLVAMLSVQLAWAQTVTGKVTDADSGEGLPGVNILVKGTTSGAVTDLDGNFSLNASSTDVLVVSSVGYLTQEIPVGSRTSINVSLAEDIQSLAEVVVVGYGTQEKKEITSSVASLQPEDFNGGNVPDPTQLLQGKVAGLSIVRPGGDPNGGFNIRLRGVSTFGANTSPLIVIDGVVGASLDNVDPNDIASIDVLKDGSAAAIYGTRGSSGVILITTKTGKAGTQIDFNNYVSIETPANNIDVLSADEFVSRGGTDEGSSTDWFDELTETGLVYSGNLSVSGGSESTTFRASINYRNSDGIVKGVGFDRLNTRFNITHSAVDDRLRLTFNGSLTNRDQESINLQAFRYAVIFNPTAPVFDDVQTDRDGGFFQNTDNFDFFNPVALANQQEYLQNRKSLLTNYRVEYDLLDNLTASLSYSQDRLNEIENEYFSQFDVVTGLGVQGRARKKNFDRFRELFEATLNYSTTLGDNVDMNLLAGYAYQAETEETFDATVDRFLFDNQGFDRLDAAGERLAPGTNLSSFRQTDDLISFFGRANFTINNTYFISASLRREGYSGFGENEKYGNFPALSFGVELTELAELGVFDQLKFRASYGVTGNLPPSPYLSIPLLVPAGRVDLDNNPITTNDVFVSLSQTNNPNPELKFEEKTEWNVGFDYSVLDGKITGSMDYYRRNISDLLYNVNVPIGAANPFLPGSFNQSNVTWANIADLEAGGFEFAASVNDVKLGSVSWTPSITFTAYDKTVIDNFSVGELGFAEIRLATPGSPGQNNNQIIRNRVGETLGNIIGPRFEGVDDDGNYILSTTNPDEFETIGNGLPSGEFGIANTFTAGNWDLNFFLRGVFGHDLYNSYRGFYENQDPGSNTWNSVTTDKTPVITQSPTFSDLYVENASFVRLDNATLGYNVPINNDYFSNLRIYLSGQNLFTITDYAGIDPEVRYSDSENDDEFTSNLAPGIERRDTYFTTRTITLGVNVRLK